MKEGRRNRGQNYVSRKRFTEIDPDGTRRYLPESLLSTEEAVYRYALKKGGETPDDPSFGIGDLVKLFGERKAPTIRNSADRLTEYGLLQRFIHEEMYRIAKTKYQITDIGREEAPYYLLD